MGQIFNEGLTSIIKGEIAYLTDDIYVALYVDAPDIDADQYRSDLTGEATGSGYTSGGRALTSKTVTTDDANNRSIADAADAQWTSTTTSYRYVVTYKRTGTPSTERLISVIDTGSLQVVDVGTIDITWPASGVFFLQNPS